MHSNYPPGGMMGSGIYSEDISMSFTCPHCMKENKDADGTTDDYKTTAYFDCEHCEEQVDIYLDTWE